MDNIRKVIEKAWQARRLGRLEDAERGLLRAIEMSRQSGARVDLIRALHSLGQVMRDLGQSERALPLCQEAADLSRQEGDDLLLAHTVRHLGDLHREAGRLEEADSCYQEALTLYGGAAQPPPLAHANALRPAALLKEDQGEVEAARQLWSQARRLYESAGVAAGVAECETRLSQLGT
ncbi:MAG TPA: tetratricopeptide repeat protein [Acidobacteriota bacterium]|nr:tetratricopeptide repeat protein [Acidobacteriota bacterium]